MRGNWPRYCQTVPLLQSAPGFRISSFIALGLLALVLTLPIESALRAEDWPEALSGMPLGGHVTHLNRTNCVDVLLHAFQSNNVVKALVFMPGATDEFYMFRRARADLTNASPSLLDALIALTNQTYIRITFRPPMLLLHTDEDPLEPVVVIEHQPTADKLKKARFPAQALYDDRDWDALQPVLKK
jgi:hypothetical protein